MRDRGIIEGWEKRLMGGKKERGEKMKVTERVISKESGERYENLCQMNERESLQKYKGVCADINT